MRARAVIIDYGSGNIHSTAKSFERMAGDAAIMVTSNAADLKTASHIVLPGVGAFADCMAGLTALPGMVAALEAEVHGAKKPFLGICVGMQLLAEKGFEHGEHEGLGWLKGSVKKLPDTGLKIPHMGWNELNLNVKHPLFSGIKNGDHAYFVHSYHMQCDVPENVLATTDYGSMVSAIVGQGNVMGTQFHPEKSQATGLRLIENFLKM